MKRKHWSWAVVTIALLIVLSMLWWRYRTASAQDRDRIARAGIRFLTHDSDGTDYWPVFSPDGKTVLFSRLRSGERQWHLFSVPISGGDAQPFLHGDFHVSATRADWSRKTNVIAFTDVTSARTSETWLVRGDGTQARALTIQGLSSETDYPSWYPDGNTLAVLDAGKGTLQRIDVEKSTATPLTSHDQVMVGMPSVSPDGRCVVFAGQKNVGQRYDQTRNSIWLTCDGGEAHPLEAGSPQGRAPTWSPDGLHITFESHRGSFVDAFYAIFVVDRTGRNLQQLTPFWINANHPVWSPDGKRLVFTARQQKSLFRYGPGVAIMDVASSH